jgi:hypothetical protein
MHRVSAKTTVWDDAMLAARNVEEQLAKSAIDLSGWAYRQMLP